MKKLYTPFRVLCIHAFDRIAINTWVYVDEVLSDEKDELQYVIFTQPVPYRYFKLPILF